MKAVQKVHIVKTERIEPRELRYEIELTRDLVKKIFDDDPSKTLDQLMKDIESGVLTGKQIQEHVDKRGFDFSKQYLVWGEEQLVSGGKILEESYKVVGQTQTRKHGIRFLMTEEGRRCYSISEAFMDAGVIARIYKGDPNTDKKRIAKMMKDVESGSFTAERMEEAMDRQGVRIEDVVYDWDQIEGSGEPQGDDPTITYEMEDCEIDE